MENYRVLQRLGKGAQGSVYLVEPKNDTKRKYVLKKVECNDEGEANKAFKEAMALQELRHPFVCGYREFFVTWDKEESAMFVCIVMNYYEFGDLAKVIKTKRQKNECIEEMIIKKWLGQMVEALVFVHKKKVIHRDLKPSNIFMTKQLNISIGDFGVATVMGDARTRTRTTVGSMNWMAPEVMDRPYDERSDVWSLGCIVLEMASCAFMDQVEISNALFEIKQNPQCLEDALNELPRVGYSVEMCQLIRTMLRRNFQQRPTAVELLDLPYIQDCLLLNPETKLVKKKVNSNSTYAEVPKNKNVLEVVKYMADNSQTEGAQKVALQYLSELSQLSEHASKFNHACKKQIVCAMKEHLTNLDIQIYGCNILLNLLATAADEDIVYTQEIIKPVLLAMRSHASSSDLQTAACSLIMAISADEAAADVIGHNGGVQDILSAMRQFSANTEICANCCGALWSLAVNEDNAKIVTQESGLQDVLNAMDNHAESPEVVETACSAIWALSLEDDNVDRIIEFAIPKIIEDALMKHATEVKVVKNAFMALASIVTCGQDCAYKIIVPSSDQIGLKIIIDAYKQHASNDDIVENFCVLLSEFCEYSDLVKEIKSPAFKLKSILAGVKKSFKGNADIQAAVNPVLKCL